VGEEASVHEQPAVFEQRSHDLVAQHPGDLKVPQ
jgi:hypothetical protein